MPKKQWPKLITKGNATVKVYRAKHPKTTSGFVFIVVWKSPEGRKTLHFADEKKALDEAGLKADLLHAGRIEAADISREDRDLITAMREKCGDIPPLAALNEWFQIRSIAGENGVTAAKEWAKKREKSQKGINVSSVITDFIKVKTSQGVKMKASYDKILPKVLKEFGERDIEGITTKELQTWF